MVLSKTFSEPPFFFKMAAIMQKCQLWAIGMKIDILGYFDVANMMEISKISEPPFFFSKWLPFIAKYQLGQISMKN